MSGFPRFRLFPRGALSVFFRNALLILPPAFLYAMKVDMPHIFLIPAVLLGIGLFRKRALSYTDRPIIYCATAALVLAVIPDMIVTVDEARFGLFDLMLRSSLVVPLLLYTAALSCFFSPNSYRIGVTAALALAAMLVCGDMFQSRDLSNTVLFFLDEPLRRYRETYAVAALIQAMTLPGYFLLFSRSVRLETGRRRTAVLRMCLLILCTLLIPVFAFSASRFYDANTRLFRHLELYFLRVGMRQNQGREMMLLSSSVNLRATLHPRLHGDPAKVLLRARSESAPGYLRGGVYTSYQNGRWSGKNTVSELQAIRRATVLSDSTFFIRSYPGAPDSVPDNPRDPPKPPLRRMDLYFDGLLTRGTIPAPGNTYRLDAVADGAELTGHGIFQLKQWKRDGGCTLFTTTSSPFPAYYGPEMDAALFRELTHLPDSVSGPLRKMASRLVAVRSFGSPREKIEFLTAFLNRRCRYSLDFSPPRDGRDPVLFFLESGRKGHCELFASSAALLLRAMGIPTRYVTGLICEERHPYSGYYLSRAADAHAWCEAWLSDEKRWIAVEATPFSSDIPMARDRRKPEALSSVLDLLKQTVQQAFADIRRGYFADAVLTVLETAVLFLHRIFRNPAVLLLLALFVFWILYRRFRRRRRRDEWEIPRETRQLAAMFARFERRVAKRTGLKRPSGSTLQAFYGDFPEEIRSVVSEYESLRYRESPPDRERIRAWERKSGEVLSHLKRGCGSFRNGV